MLKLSSQEEINMWMDWKKNPDDVNRWQNLYKTFKPVIMSAIKKNSYGSNLPQSVHFAYAVQHFDEALKTYNPNSNAKLSSWIYNNVENRGKRLNAKYANIAYIPESRYYRVQTYNNAVSELRDKLNREPSTQEIADHLAWSPKQVSLIRSELRADLQESEELTAQNPLFSSNLREAIEYAYYELTPEEQVVYEYMFGAHGKPVLKNSKGLIDFPAISRATGIPLNRIQYLKSNILSKIKKLK